MATTTTFQCLVLCLLISTGLAVPEARPAGGWGPAPWMQGGRFPGGWFSGGRGQSSWNDVGAKQGGGNQGGWMNTGGNQGGRNQGGWNNAGWNQGGWNQGGHHGGGGRPKVCLAGAESSTISLLQDHLPAKQYCSKYYPVQCTSALAARNEPPSIMTDSPELLPRWWFGQGWGNPKESCWNSARSKGGNWLSSICSCIETPTACPTSKAAFSTYLGILC